MVSGSPSPRARPRIAFLCDALGRYQTRVADGAKRAALSLGADIVCFLGGYFTGGGRARSRVDTSFIYELARPPSVDAMVVIGTVLANEVGVDYVREFCRKSQLPVVSVGRLPGFPHVIPDNVGGLRAVLEHLIVDHQLQRFAFIRGCTGNPESLERESVFRAVLESHGLPVREELFLPGAFVQVSGSLAIRELFDERKIGVEEVDAIVAVNDQTAIGAMSELLARGLSIPGDVAVVGFDDDDSAALKEPPLTTVRQPLEAIGRRAVELLMDCLRGRSTPACVRVETKPVLRGSCGCARRDRGVVPRLFPAEPKALPTLERLRRECREAAIPLSETAPTVVQALFDAFIQALSGSDVDLEPFTRAVAKTVADGEDPLRWLDILQLIEAEVDCQQPADPVLVARGRWFLVQANLVVTETAARANATSQESAPDHSAALEVLNCALMSAEDEDALASVLIAALPAFGIRFCCVCLFDDTSSDRSRARVIAAYDSRRLPQGSPLPGVGAWWSLAGRVMGLPADALATESHAAVVFSAKDLLPEGLRADDAPTFLSVHPLSFARKPLGYAVFDQPWRHGQAWTPRAVAEQLSNAIYVLRQAERLRRARLTAEAASTAKSEFVARMSHEIRTPLTAVMGYLDLCLRRISEPTERRYLMQAQASSKVLLGVLNDILDFSKIEAQLLEVEHTRFELEQVLDQIVATCAAAAFGKNVELVLDVADDVPKALVGDPLRLTQVLVNLVGNAVKFTSRGEVTLSISIDHPSGDRGPTFLRFRVRDTGIGIARENLSKLMVPFIQADNSTTRRYGGTGLGLAISQRLIHHMGGSLELRSELGRGTECSFTLEFSDAGEYVFGDDGAYCPDLEAVLVDDNPALLAVVTRMLSQAGFRVRTATDGEAAIELLQSARRTRSVVHLLLIDQGLPDHTGSDVVRRLVELDLVGDCRILIMAPLGELEASTTLLAPEAMNGIVSKPVRLSDLAARIRSLFGLAEGMSATRPGSSTRPDADAELAGKRVLVVQDDEVNRMLAEELLQSAGLEVHAVESGVEAVERVAELRYDAVLMDLHLPLMDGCEATRIIRQKPGGAELPIIAMTACASTEDRERCFDVGMNDYLQTPIDSTNLLAALARWVGKCGSDGAEARAVPSPATSVGSLAAGGIDVSEMGGDWLDMRGALRRLRGDAALYRRLLRRFLETHRCSAEQLRDRDQMEQCLRNVHSMASAAANVGALELHRVAHALELDLRSGNGATEAAWDKLGNVLAKTLEIVATASGKSTRPPPGLVDRERLRRELATLATLLDGFDARASDIVDKLPAVVGSDAVNEEVRRIRRAVRAYDFEGARRRVENLLTILQQEGN